MDQDQNLLLELVPILAVAGILVSVIWKCWSRDWS